MADIRQGLAGREKIILSVAPIYLMTTYGSYYAQRRSSTDAALQRVGLILD